MNNKVMAKVNGEPITMADISYFIQAMGPQGAQYDNEQGHQVILEQLISQRLIYLDASKNGLAFEAEYKKQLEMAKRDLLTSYALNKLLMSINVSKAECKEEYMKDPSVFSSGNTVNASHILVDNEDKAKEILESIKSGEKTFEDAAAEFSSCPSSANGGNLGDFARGSMVKEFEEAAFKMEVDEVSEPVKTQFGYHIIKLISKSESKAKSFEEVESEIMQKLTGDARQKALESKINQLKILYPVDVEKDNSGIII